MSLLDTAHKSPTYWFIVFEEAETQAWWNRYLKDGYSHVYAIQWDGAHWIRVEPRIGFVDVEVLPYGDDCNIFDVVETDWSDILHVTAWREDRVRVPWIFGAVTCVEAIKSLLGIREQLILTPWQLAKYLRGIYGEQSKKPGSNRRTKGARALSVRGYTGTPGR